VLHVKLRNRTCQGLDRQGQGQGLKFGPQGVLKDKDMDKD